jgi:hypothetical protein
MRHPPLHGLKPELAVEGHSVWIEVAPLFVPTEFSRPFDMDVHFLRLLYKARLSANTPFRIVKPGGDHRPPGVNRGAANSAHMSRPCRAVDLSVRNNYERAEVIMAAVRVGILRIGIYPSREDGSGGLHLDASEVHPFPRFWTRY